MTFQPYNADTFRTSDSLGYLIKVAHTMMLSGAEKSFEQAGVSFSQWIAMRKLKEYGSLNPGDLCRALRHDSGAMTRLLDQLVNLGYVTRERSEKDRRLVELTLTPEGEAKVDELMPHFLQLLNGMCSEFNAEEFELLVGLLKRLISRVGVMSGNEVPEVLR